jgi:hypothetical protein
VETLAKITNNLRQLELIHKIRLSVLSSSTNKSQQEAKDLKRIKEYFELKIGEKGFLTSETQKVELSETIPYVDISQGLKSMKELNEKIEALMEVKDEIKFPKDQGEFVVLYTILDRFKYEEVPYEYFMSMQEILLKQESLEE